MWCEGGGVGASRLQRGSSTDRVQRRTSRLSPVSSSRTTARPPHPPPPPDGTTSNSALRQSHQLHTSSSQFQLFLYQHPTSPTRTRRFNPVSSKCSSATTNGPHPPVRTIGLRLTRAKNQLQSVPTVRVPVLDLILLELRQTPASDNQIRPRGR